MSVRRLLLVSPYFPPSAVIGVKRALNYCRNLPRFGWQPVVLAAPPDSVAQASELLDLVPRGTVVSRGFESSLTTRVRERRAETRPVTPPGSDTKTARVRYQYLTPFDRYLWSTGGAVREGLALIRAHRPEAILVNADPWTGLLVGHLLHRLSGLPWVADLRDPWSLHAAKMALRPRVSRAVVRRSEAAFFRSAAKVVLNCDAALEAYRTAYRGKLPEHRLTCIRNAFDPGVFDPGSEPPPAPFTVAYFGSFKPFVGAPPILGAFSALVRRRRLDPTQARLLVVGGPIADRDVDRHGLRGYVEVRPRVPLTRALKILRGATALIFLVEPSTPLVIPGKLYDYLAAGRPILALSGSSEVNGIVERTRTGLVTPFGDAEAAAGALERMLDGTFRFEPDEVEVARYSAAAQAERMAEVLTEVAR